MHAHKLASAYSGPGELVFCSTEGTPLDQRNVARRGLEKAVDAAGLDGNGKPSLTMHSLRHVFVSLLIEQGHDVVYISRQVGHAKPSITTDVYGHLFDKRSRDEATRAALEAD